MKYLCCIFNYAPHYRLPIYKLLDNELKAHFFFGNRLYNDTIEKLDYESIYGFKKELDTHFIKIGKYLFEYTYGWVSLALNPIYNKYLITPNQYSINQWLFLLISFILRKDVYVWMHGIKSSKISKKALFINKAYDFFVKGSFLYGNQAKRNMVRLGFNEKKLYVIYNSLNYEESRKIRKSSIDSENPFRLHFRNDNPVLLFIGRLTKVKKLNMILEAYLILKKKGVLVNIVFIGDGPERKILEDKLNNEEKNNFWFIGSLYEEDIIAKYLYHADICISPGNVGLTAIHAHSYGLPVITNDDYESQMPEFEVIRESETGLFYKNEDVNDLADKIIIWIKHKMNNRGEIRKKCYKEIDEKYNPYNQIEIFKSVLDK